MYLKTLGESMILTLKNNKNLKRLKKKIIKSVFVKSTKTESLYNFPEATPELLEKIRLQMAIQNKEEIIYYLISMVVTLIIVLFLLV